MSTPQKSEETLTKRVLRTPAQDRLKRLQGSIKKIYKSTNRRHSDGHDNKKSKNSSSKIHHRLDISDPNFYGLSTSAFAAPLRNKAKGDDITLSSSPQKAKSATEATFVHVTTPLQLQQQQQTTPKNGNESLVLPSSKTKRRLPSDSLLIEQNRNASAAATSKNNDDESKVALSKKRRREEANFVANAKLQEQKPPSAAKPFQEQKQNIAGVAASTAGAAVGSAGAAAGTATAAADTSIAAAETDIFDVADKIDAPYLRENFITTKRNFLQVVVNRASSSLKGHFATASAAATPANSPSKSSPDQSLFFNENQNYNVAISKPTFLNSAKSKLQNFWQKPKAALLDSIKKFHSYTTTSSKNIANDRLNRYRANLLQNQQNLMTNETIVSLANTTLPSSNSNYGTDSMDWQSSEENAELNTLCNDDGTVSTTSSTSSGSSYISVFDLDCTDFLMKHAMTDNTKESSLAARKQNYMYFVLDTNILLSYIVFVEELTKLSLYEETDGNVVFIPYKVIQELDNIKHRGTDSNRMKSSRAIRFLNDNLDSAHIQAQTAFAESKHLIQIDSPDDSIINCCLQLKKEVQHMILLTDDGNMMLKAKVNGILATTKSDLTTKFQNKFLSLDEN